MNGKIELILNGNKVTVMGGPYRERPEEVRGVKLAPEIDAVCDWSINIPDFGVPDISEVEGLVEELMLHLLIAPRPVIYVGCMGGIGRTGMIMACLAKAITYFEIGRKHKSLWNRIKKFFGYDITSDTEKAIANDVIGWLRASYIPHTIETKAQEQLVEEFDPTRLVVTLMHSLKLN